MSLGNLGGGVAAACVATGGGVGVARATGTSVSGRLLVAGTITLPGTVSRRVCEPGCTERRSGFTLPSVLAGVLFAAAAASTAAASRRCRMK